MSRIVDADFGVLINYLTGYSLAIPIQNKSYVALIKKTHKRYLAALTFIAEVESQGAGTKKRTKKAQATLDYCKESVSDLGSAVFALANGAHKPGRMMCRSALETLSKGLAASESLKVLKERSVFSVVKDAKSIPLFKAEVPARYFVKLETLYGQLCEDVHTATIQNMAHISAISAFPNFDLDKSTKLANIITEAAILITSLLTMFYREFYLHMHHSNKPIVRGALHKEVIQNLAGA